MFMYDIYTVTEEERYRLEISSQLRVLHLIRCHRRKLVPVMLEMFIIAVLHVYYSLMEKEEIYKIRETG